MSRRDIPGKAGKTYGVSLEPSVVVSVVEDTLIQVQQSMLEAATRFRDENIVDVTTYEELKVTVNSCSTYYLFSA